LSFVGSTRGDSAVPTSKSADDNTQHILDENDPEYQALYSKYLDVVTKSARPSISPLSMTLRLPSPHSRIEKDYNHVRANIASQREKATENYRREHDKAINRQNDLNKQLANMEERFKVCLVASCSLLNSDPL
jgi:hypothetical protein